MNTLEAIQEIKEICEQTPLLPVSMLKGVVLDTDRAIANILNIIKEVEEHGANG